MTNRSRIVDPDCARAADRFQSSFAHFFGMAACVAGPGSVSHHAGCLVIVPLKIRYDRVKVRKSR